MRNAVPRFRRCLSKDSCFLLQPAGILRDLRPALRCRQVHARVGKTSMYILVLFCFVFFSFTNAPKAKAKKWNYESNAGCILGTTPIMPIRDVAAVARV